MSCRHTRADSRQMFDWMDRLAARIGWDAGPAIPTQRKGDATPWGWLHHCTSRAEVSRRLQARRSAALYRTADMERRALGVPDPTDVRLAELVAALSLGIDLGFGQPMEHVLRQCLIASRLAERLGLDQEERAVVYYTALLVNIGCHSDAHEQAKWFGDDIASKATKYDYEIPSVRGMAATMRKIGAGNPPLHRFRIGLEFALSGHREVDAMISHHAAMARALGEELALPEEVLDALGGAYEQWDGRGWPAGVAGAAVPLAARVAQFA